MALSLSETTSFVCGGGICSSSSVESSRLMISLASGLPGTMASSPDLPPLRADSRKIQPQLTFSSMVVHAVTGKALLSEDGTHFAIKIDGECRRKAED
jgi:hypothetical protein